MITKRQTLHFYGSAVSDSELGMGCVDVSSIDLFDCEEVEDEEEVA